MFTADGRLRDDNWQEAGAWREQPPRGFLLLANIRKIAADFGSVERRFKSLPPDLQKQIIRALAVEAVKFVHRDEVRRYLLELEWKRDIEAANPEWYKSTPWPDDKLEKVDFPGYGKVSKADLWVRMMWRRRGEFIFTTAKEAVQEAMK